VTLYTISTARLGTHDFILSFGSGEQRFHLPLAFPTSFHLPFRIGYAQ
jgi:hypothetical protein